MGIPISLFLIAGGAILAFAVTGGSDSNVDIPVAGFIVMVAGLVGLLLSLVLWDSWAGGSYWRRGAPPPEPRRRYPPLT
jgi:hypothetical protein